MTHTSRASETIITAAQIVYTSPRRASSVKGLSAQDVYDITIIGGGPTGLFASFYAGLSQMRTKIVDALEELGGQVAVLYPEKYIYDVGGFPKVTGKDLVKGMVDQALKFNPTVVVGER